MSLLTDASLIVTPNAYNVGKLYSVIPNTTLGDMDVSRGSSATRVNEQKLIEIARTNLATYSEGVLSSYPSNSNVTNASTSILGFANSIQFGNNSLERYCYKSIAVTIGQIYSLSLFVQMDDNTVPIVGAATTSGDFGMVINGNLQTSSVVTLTSTTNVYKISSTYTITGGSGSFGLVKYTGQSSKSFRFSGIQIELSSVATAYIPTTTLIRTKFAGITQDGLLASNIPRIDYPPLGGCPSILVEPARTNLVLYSEEFDNASWFKSNVTVTPNTTATLAPDGTTTADKVVATNLTFDLRTSTQISITNGSTYTWSAYVKNAGFKYVRMTAWTNDDPRTTFDLDTITVTSETLPAHTSKIEDIGNGWRRVIITRTSTDANAWLKIIPSNSPTTSGTVNGVDGVYIWGAQLELGSNATSYIPTTTAPVPRAADVIRNLSATTLIGQTQGTMYAEIDIKAFDIGAFFTISDGTSVNYIQMYTYNNNRIYCDIYASSVASNINTGITPLSVGTYKVAFAYQSGNSYLYINGAQVGATLAATFTFGSMGKVNIGTGYADSTFFNNRIKSAILFKTRLTPDQCILLTGPSFSSYVEMANNFPNTLIYSLQ